MNIQFSKKKDLNDSEILENFEQITPDGKLYTGFKAMNYWADKRNVNIDIAINNYILMYRKYDIYKDSSGLIDATMKIKNTFINNCFIDQAYISEFSAIEIYGKTPTYAKLLYAKQSADENNIKDLIREPVLKIKELIRNQNILAIGFITPSIARNVQLITEIQNAINTDLPIIKIDKIKNDYIVPQKTLKNTADRIENAIKTFEVINQEIPNKILLIDDFIGSGSSLNFVAEKIKKINPNCIINCFAIAGTPNGIINNSNKYEVVSEI